MSQSSHSFSNGLAEVQPKGGDDEHVWRIAATFHHTFFGLQGTQAFREGCVSHDRCTWYANFHAINYAHGKSNSRQGDKSERLESGPSRLMDPHLFTIFSISLIDTWFVGSPMGNFISWHYVHHYGNSVTYSICEEPKLDVQRSQSVMYANRQYGYYYAQRNKFLFFSCDSISA